MPRISKLAKLTRARSITSGLFKHFAPRIKHRIAGNRYSQREMIAVFQSHLEAIEEVDAARARLGAAVQKERALGRRADALSMELKAFIENRFGANVVVLADFGWRPPKKPGPKTVAAKLAGVKKREAKRKG
jgi:hypothetical protein